MNRRQFIGTGLAAAAVLKVVGPFGASEQLCPFPLVHNIKPFEVQFPEGVVKYPSGTVVLAGEGPWYVYAYDPEYEGGAASYHVTTAAAETFGNGKILISKVSSLRDLLPGLEV